MSIGAAVYFVSSTTTRQAEAGLQRGLIEAGALVDQQCATFLQTLTVMARLVADNPRLKAAVDTGDPPTVQPFAREYQQQVGAALIVLTGQDRKRARRGGRSGHRRRHDRHTACHSAGPGRARVQRILASRRGRASGDDGADYARYDRTRSPRNHGHADGWIAPRQQSCGDLQARDGERHRVCRRRRDPGLDAAARRPPAPRAVVEDRRRAGRVARKRRVRRAEAAAGSGRSGDERRNRAERAASPVALRAAAVPERHQHGSWRRRHARRARGDDSQLRRRAHDYQAARHNYERDARDVCHRRPDPENLIETCRQLGGRGCQAARVDVQYPDRLHRAFSARGHAARAALGARPPVDGHRARNPESADDHQGVAADAVERACEPGGNQTGADRRGRGGCAAEPDRERRARLRASHPVRLRAMPTSTRCAPMSSRPRAASIRTCPSSSSPIPRFGPSSSTPSGCASHSSIS